MKKVVDSNGNDGAIHGKPDRHCSRETLNGIFSFKNNALVLLVSCMLFHRLLPVCLN